MDTITNGRTPCRSPTIIMFSGYFGGLLTVYLFLIFLDKYFFFKFLSFFCSLFWVRIISSIRGTAYLRLKISRNRRRESIVVYLEGIDAKLRGNVTFLWSENETKNLTLEKEWTISAKIESKAPLFDFPVRDDTWFLAISKKKRVKVLSK